MSQTVTPYLEMSQAIVDAGGEALKKCYQCGTCTGTCPWTPITHFNIRKLVRFGQLGIDGIEEYMWGCSTCKFCVDRCPRGVELSMWSPRYAMFTAAEECFRRVCAPLSVLCRRAAIPGRAIRASETTGPKKNIRFIPPIRNICSGLAVPFAMIPAMSRLAKADCRNIESGRHKLGAAACGSKLLRRELEKSRRSGVV